MWFYNFLNVGFYNSKCQAEMKDNWDKFGIIVKTIALGIIPLVIGFGADKIAKSLETGELVQSLISDLTQPDTKRDVALIALDAAIQKNEKCKILWMWECQNDTDKDQVLDIAVVLVNNSINEALEEGQSPEELLVAKQIIIKRASEKFYKDKFDQPYRSFASKTRRQAISEVQNTKLSGMVLASKANTSQTIAAIQPLSAKPTNDNLAGVRIVYIQYESDKELAENLQKALQDKNISVPSIEKVEGIKQNNIRYANAADKQIAENLQAYIVGDQNIQIEQLIDLSTTGYRVSSGQFEIWLE